MNKNGRKLDKKQCKGDKRLTDQQHNLNRTHTDKCLIHTSQILKIKKYKIQQEREYIILFKYKLRVSIKLNVWGIARSGLMCA